MRDQADKYFELLPILLIALIMILAETREAAPVQPTSLQTAEWQISLPQPSTLVLPKVQFR